MVVTFNCAAHTWLLFMISFGLSCVGLIWGTNTENNSKRDTCSTVWGEKMLSSCHSGGFFEAEGISARDLDLGRKGLLSLPRLMGLQLYAFWSRWTAVLHFPDLLVVLKTANSTTVKGLWFFGLLPCCWDEQCSWPFRGTGLGRFPDPQRWKIVDALAPLPAITSPTRTGFPHGYQEQMQEFVGEDCQPWRRKAALLLRPHHLRHAGHKGIGQSWLGLGRLSDRSHLAIWLLIAGMLCHQWMRHSWDSCWRETKKLMWFGVL